MVDVCFWIECSTPELTLIRDALDILNPEGDGVALRDALLDEINGVLYGREED